MIWFNGQLVDDAASAATSAGMLLGWGVFTTIGVWNARPFALQQHLARLKHDAAHCEIEYSIDDATLGNALREVIKRNQIVRGIARITITKRGDGRWNTASGSDVSIVVRPMEDIVTPATITFSPFHLHSNRALAGVKSTSNLDYQLAWREAQSRGFDEAILLNQNEHICEGARSNLFWTCNGELFTPSRQTGCLPGIARSLVLRWAQERDVVTHEVELTLDKFFEAKSVFLTSAATGVREVCAFDGRNLPTNNLISHLQDCWRDAANHGD
jgi:branched-subunit amino acid aminotransferase/4-amino-4-deoxychorismate lyase